MKGQGRSVPHPYHTRGGSKMNVELDNRIYAMQQKKGLTEEAQSLVTKADIAYLQDREDDALRYIVMAETIMEIEIMKDIMSLGEAFKEILESKVQHLEQQGIKEGRVVRLDRYKK